MARPRSRLRLSRPKDYVPQEIVTDILSRLPAKPLVRFKSVCQSWRSLVSDPEFVSAHLRRSPSALLHMPVSFCTGRKEFTLLDLENFQVNYKVEVPFTTNSGSYLIVGSCAGVLCVTDCSSDYYGLSLYLWNPSIRSHKSLNDSCVAHRFLDLCFQVVIGFGFVAPSQALKIIRVFYVLDGDKDADTQHFNKAPPEAELYSSLTGEWRSVGAIVPRIVDGKPGVFVNGSVHWIASNSEMGYYELIVYFNMVDEVFGEMALPSNCFDGIGLDGAILAQAKDTISLFVYCHVNGVNWCNNQCQIWVMKEYGKAESWKKQYTIVLEEQVGRPFGFVSNGKVLMDNEEDQMVIWEPKNHSIKVVDSVETSFSFNAFGFVESLVGVGNGDGGVGKFRRVEGVCFKGINILIEDDQEQTGKGCSCIIDLEEDGEEEEAGEGCSRIIDLAEDGKEEEAGEGCSRIIDLEEDGEKKKPRSSCDNDIIFI